MSENHIDILGVKVSQISFRQALETIEGFLTDGRKHLVTTPYAESIVAAQKDEGFREIINQSDLAVPDGGGLLAAAEFLSRPLPAAPFLRFLAAIFYGGLSGLKLMFWPKGFRVIGERVSGTDLVRELCRLADQKGLKVFFLGGWGGAAVKAAAQLKINNHELKIETLEGPKDVTTASAEEINTIINHINDFAPDFLFVAFGPVIQEKWLEREMGRINAKVFMAVGGAFNMISGQTPRAPAVLRRLGLEWLWRLILEPSRFKRIYKAVIVFPWLVFKQKLGS